MEDVVLAGDVDVGDVIVLPGSDEPVLVSRVRLGQGGLIFTVAPAGGDAAEEDRPVKLTAEVRLRKRGRDLVLVPNGPGVTPRQRPRPGSYRLWILILPVRLDRRRSHG